MSLMMLLIALFGLAMVINQTRRGKIFRKEES